MINKNWKRRDDTKRETLIEEFKNPGKEYNPYAFWFWMDNNPAPKEYGRQVTDMAKKNLSSGYAQDRAFAGGQGETYYQCMDEAVKAAKEAGISLGYCDPNHLHRGPELIGDDKDLRAISLMPKREDIKKGEEKTVSPDAFCAVAVELFDDSSLDSDNMTLYGANDKIRAENKNIRLFTFTEFSDCYAEGGAFTNFLHHGISDKHKEYFHKEMVRRYKDDLGDTVSGFFYDLEGAYGYKISYSYDVERTYEERTGRSYRQNLPLLLEEDRQGKWMRARYDYYDTVSECYTKYTFKEGSDYLEKLGVTFSIHLFEEHLVGQTFCAGDPMRVYRAVTLPGIDHLFANPFVSKSYKEVQSVCEFDGKRFLCEILGVAGWHKTPLDFRKSANNALAMGVSHFVPHGVFSNRKDIMGVNYAPDFFDWAPGWEYFDKYTDYVRRGSLITSQGRMYADTLLINPLNTVWALAGDYAFDEYHPFTRKWMNGEHGEGFLHEKELCEIDKEYINLVERLTDSSVGFLIGDEFYLEKAEVKDGKLIIRGFEFTSVIIPSIRIIKTAILEKLVKFLDEGGKIIYTGTLPDASTENGLGDEYIISLSEKIRYHKNADLAAVPESGELIHPFLHPFLKFEGEGFRIHAQKRIIDSHAYYMLSNNNAEDKEVTVFFPDAHGRAIVWSLEDATRIPIPSRDTKEGSYITHNFYEGDGFYLEFDPDLCAVNSTQSNPTYKSAEVNPIWNIKIDPEKQMINPTGFDAGITDEYIKGKKTTLCNLYANGLERFSGFVDYYGEFSLCEDAYEAVIDLCRVRCMATLTIDGKEIGRRYWGPYRFTTDNLKKGKHEIHVRVGTLLVNLLFPHRNDVKPNQWRMDSLIGADSAFETGLIGPVKILYK